MRGLPAESRDALARILLELAGEDPSVAQLSADEEESLKASLLEAERGEFATDDEIKAIWAKHGLWRLRHAPAPAAGSDVLHCYTVISITPSGRIGAISCDCEARN